MEDDLSARRAISRILRLEGFVPSEAGTVREAVAALAARPDWVVLDLMLPDGCGSRVLETVRDERLDCAVCVVTGCDAARREVARRLGAQHILVKPLDVPKLISVLSAPAGRRAQGERI